MQITIDGLTATKLLLLRNKLSNKYGYRVTWTQIVAYLVEQAMEIPKYEGVIRELKEKIEGMHSKTEHFLELSLQRPINSTPIMAMQQNNNPLAPPPPPIPLPSIQEPPTLPPKNIIIEVSQDIKNDFKKELDSVCKSLSNGERLKPSDVLKGIKDVKVIDTTIIPIPKETKN